MTGRSEAPPHRKPAPDLGASEPLPPRGRAQRWSTAAGELWRLPPGSDAVVARLVRLGETGLGGFIDGGTDDHGPWLLRTGGSSLDERMRATESPMPWRDAVWIASAVATALAAAEDACLFPGPLHPKAVWLCDAQPRVVVRADALVDSLVGVATAPSTQSGGALSRWIAPAQARGAPWDNGANRYVLGLILYRMLAGEHPFAGKGLRLGLSDQARRGAPPMPDAVAASLPPGLQSLVLRMLAVEPSERPSESSGLSQRLQAIASTHTERPRATRPNVVLTQIAVETSGPRFAGELPAKVTASPQPRRSKRSWRLLVGVLPIVGGLGLYGLLGHDVAKPKPRPTPRVGATAPLDGAHTRPDDCATCHPRQTAQWHGSVMAHSVRSPLFQALEILIEEQVGRSFDCPDGAGILRQSDGRTACRDRDSGLPITGSGGELWCVNCHSPGENLQEVMPAWDAFSRRSSTRRPLVDLLPAATMDGISCAFCHQAHGPVQPGNEQRGLYEGNPFWTSTLTGQRFSMRPEDRLGRPGVANSGYFLDPSELLGDDSVRRVRTGAHVRPTEDARAYVQSSAFCGSCHDVRLFGTDAIGVQRGEHFKRLRNAYSEWVDWAADERRAGREPASCQDCHMSTFPGVCVPDDEAADLRDAFSSLGATALRRACPDGHRFEPRDPGQRPRATVATSSAGHTEVSTHYFTGVDVPLSAAFDEALVDDPTLDAHGIPRGAKQRRDMLLGRTFRFEVDARRFGGRLEIPVSIENIGGGHKVPAGFSQEREIWVHLRVTDADGRVLYEVGRVDRDDQDLRDKTFLRVNTDDRFVDEQGRPLGVFGADVADGPDVPLWSPPPETGANAFRGRGLINLQNGFLRCVRCIGEIDARGRCRPGPGQRRHRAARFADGDYDPDTGQCLSNLSGDARFFETYFPVGSLDSTRGVVRGPDAIIDTRSAPPGVPRTYTYDLPISRRGPLRVQARLLFRAFPPFLVRAFIDYEARQAARGLRPSGPLVTPEALDRLEVVELHRLEIEVP